MPTLADYSVPVSLVEPLPVPLHGYQPTPLLAPLLDSQADQTQGCMGGIISNLGVATTANPLDCSIGNYTYNNLITYQTAGSAATNYLWPISWPTQSVTAQYITYNIQYQYQQQCFVNRWISVDNCIPETPEQKIAREEQEVKRIAASKRAEDLLLLHLSDLQKADYLEKGYFETTVNDKVYRINKGRAGNVYLIEKGKTKYRYCAHPSAYTPEGDAMLAQLLMLKTDEARFIKTANRTELYG